MGARSGDRGRPWALRVIGAPQSDLIGRKAAIFGLALAMLFGGWAPARRFTQRRLLYRQATVFVEQWLQVVRDGRLQEAYQMHVPYSVRGDIYEALQQPAGKPARRTLQRNQPSGPESEKPVLPVDPHVEMAEFLSKPAVATLVAHARDGRLRLRKNETQRRRRQLTVLVQHYVFEYEEGGQPQTLPLRIQLLRTLDPPPNRGAQWTLETISPEAS